jgi:hypothetical protein
MSNGFVEYFNGKEYVEVADHERIIEAVRRAVTRNYMLALENVTDTALAAIESLEATIKRLKANGQG